MGVAAWHSRPCLRHCWRLTASEQAACTWAQQSHKRTLRRSETHIAIKLCSAPQHRVLFLSRQLQVQQSCCDGHTKQSCMRFGELCMACGQLLSSLLLHHPTAWTCSTSFGPSPSPPVLR